METSSSLVVAAGFVLGMIPSLTNAFVASAVGYLTDLTGTTCIFYKVLLCLYLMGALATWLQGQSDQYFDVRVKDARAVWGFRIFVPCLLIAIVFLSLGELLAHASAGHFEVSSHGPGLLALVAVAGFCAGALQGVAAVVIGAGCGEQQIVFVWIGIAFAGMLCIAFVYATGFTPNASATCVRFFFYSGAGLVLICMSFLGALHYRQDLDVAYEKASTSRTQQIDEATPIVEEGTQEQDIDWAPYISGVSCFITIFCFPLLPTFCSSSLAQELVLWKLFMDFVGPVSLVPVPQKGMSTLLLGIMLAVRATMLIAVLFLLRSSSQSTAAEKSNHWVLVGSWDVMMFIGALLGCLADRTDTRAKATPVGKLQRLRQMRFANNLGLTIGLVTSGTIMYMIAGPLKHPEQGIRKESMIEMDQKQLLTTSFVGSCPTCAKPLPDKGALKEFPCGSEGNTDSPGLLLFHYGANMGCSKLTAIRVQPQSAQAAYIPGQCLRFGTAENVPTSATEPGYGNLVPCKDGCVHGVLHKIPKHQLSKISATESGYELVEMPEVIGYDGRRTSGAKAYVMRGNFTARPPSRRYGGLLYCTARSELAPAYASQLSCQLGEHGHEDLSCEGESFEPLAAQSGASSYSLIFAVPLGVLAFSPAIAILT